MLVHTVQHNFVVLLYRIDLAEGQYPELQVKVLLHKTESVTQLQLVLVIVLNPLPLFLRAHPQTDSLLECQQQDLLKEDRVVHHVAESHLHPRINHHAVDFFREQLQKLFPFDPPSISHLCVERRSVHDVFEGVQASCIVK